MSKYDKVKSFYDAKLWPLAWVIDAVDKWIPTLVSLEQ
jgi:hypothetical protein